MVKCFLSRYTKRVNAETGKAPVKYIEIDRRQMSLRSIDVEALIDEMHGARTIWEFVGRLKLEKFEAKAKSFEGQAGRAIWSPRLLISMWIRMRSTGRDEGRTLRRTFARLWGTLDRKHHMNTTGVAICEAG